MTMERKASAWGPLALAGYGVAAAAGVLGGISCTELGINTGHCMANTGDVFCAAKHPNRSRPYCTLGSCLLSPDYHDGCVAELPEGDEGMDCYTPCGIRGCGEDTGAADDAGASGEGTGGIMTTAGPTEDDGSPDPDGTAGSGCEAAGDCTDPVFPVCDEGVCVPCEAVADPDAACAATDPATPVCDGARCVECSAENTNACSGMTPACDVASQQCVACTYHAQCPASACHIAEGSCMPTERVWTVGVFPTNVPAADFVTIADAVASLNDGEKATLIVYETMNPYSEPLMVDENRVVAMLPAPGNRPEIAGVVSSPLLAVENGAVVYLDGFHVFGNDVGEGLYVDKAEIHVDRSEIVNHAQGSIVVFNGSHLGLRNSTAGGGAGDVAAVSVDGGSAEILYSTLGGGEVDAPALSCDGPLSITIRNSILVARGPTFRTSV